ncbi:MAG TPA: glycosyltransferase family 1 protein [Vitreimonas sp.]|nr:glycosyltransferase family 1 protein [Vitreimonas sp.]
MKPLRIAIDGNEANVSHRVGSNVYAYEILRSLEKQTRNDANTTFTILLTQSPHQDLPSARPGWKYQQLKPAALATQFALPLHLFLYKDKYDVFFTPGHYAPRLSAVPYVSSVMDLAFLHFPEQFKKRDLLQLKSWTKYSVLRARKVIAISEFTKDDVVREYGKKPGDVVVAYPAVNTKHRHSLPAKAKAALRKQKISQPYILYVGTLQPRKNVERLIEGFEKLVYKYLASSKSSRNHLNSQQLQLVIAGKLGWLADGILERVKASPLKDQIILTGFVSDEMKDILYHYAECSVLVGLYEGFGIPPLESLNKSVVPVVSNTTSLPEVVGKAGILVDPYQPDDIGRGLYEAIMLTAKQRGQLLKHARQQLKKFDWDRSAMVILNTLHEVAKK